VILDDIEPTFFTQDQLLMLRQFVSLRGGGLLMMGGQESFDADRFATGPLGELSPVYAPRRSEESVADLYQLDMTREGLLQPWFRLRDTEDGETQRLRAMPPFKSVNQVGDVKPGAIKLATVRDSSNRIKPAMASQRFGNGKTAALLISDTWRWPMRRKDGDEDDPARMWRQLIRWLVSDVPVRASISIQPNEADLGQVTLSVDVRDESFQPLDNAKVEVCVTPIGAATDTQSEPTKLAAQSDHELRGRYNTTYFANQDGGYLATIRVLAEDGSEIASARSGWTTQRSGAEFQSWEINRELLNTIATQSGGEVVPEASLASFVADLSQRKVPVSQAWTYPIWHRGYVMMLAIACLCGEWGLRRWKGFA